MASLDTQIRDVERAFLAARSRMDVLEAPFRFPENCCPTCACGPEWRDLADKRERQAFVLARLFVRRDGPADRDRAERLFLDFGARNADWKRWRLRAALAAKGEDHG